MAKKSEKIDEVRSGFLWKANLVYFLMLLFALCIIVKAVMLVVKGDKLVEDAIRKVFSEEKVDAVRGNIYSSDNSLLAVTVPLFDVRLDFNPNPEYDKLFRENVGALCDSLHRMFPEKSSREYREYFRENRRRKLRDRAFKSSLTYAQLERLRTFPIFREGKYRGGFIVVEREVRRRPNGKLAARTIGYYRENGNIQVGLEGAYNEYLEGQDGKRTVQRVEGRLPRPVFDNDAVEAVDGKDVMTTIDIRIQDVAESALQECMELNEAQSGCVVLMEVATGKIVAIANLQKTEEGTYEEMMNHAVGEAVEPGSTFKLASVIALLEESGKDTSVIVPTGEMKFYNRWMRDSHRGGWGDISLREAFEKSSNVGISYLTNEVFLNKQQKFVDYLGKMHLDRPLGVEIKGEGKPYIKNTRDKTWSGVSLPWMSIGYELQVTPLQILALYNAVANNGKMMKPLFVTEVRSEGKLVKSFQPQVLVDRICSQSTLDKVKGMLEGTVEKGTAVCLSNPLYKVAAKTGTAQTNYWRRGSERMTYRASIVGYFPADRPKYSCIVMITNPQKNRFYGGAVAGPVFRDIADKVFATLMKGGQEPEQYSKYGYGPVYANGYGSDIETVYQKLGIHLPEIETSSFFRYHGTGVIGEGQFSEVKLMKEVLPDLKGLGLRDAAFLLEKYGLKFQASGKGRVVSQQPSAGVACAPGQTVYLELR